MFQNLATIIIFQLRLLMNSWLWIGLENENGLKIINSTSSTLKGRKYPGGHKETSCVCKKHQVTLLHYCCLHTHTQTVLVPPQTLLDRLQSAVAAQRQEAELSVMHRIKPGHRHTGLRPENRRCVRVKLWICWLLLQVKSNRKASNSWINAQGDAINTINTLMSAFKKSYCSLCRQYHNVKYHVWDRFMKNVTRVSPL